MSQLNRVHSEIGKELREEPPPWDAIEPQAKEYAQIAASLGQHDPPMGSKESWARLTESFGRSAASLDRAAQARDREAALTAHKTLAKSCQGCHVEHQLSLP